MEKDTNRIIENFVFVITVFHGFIIFFTYISLNPYCVENKHLKFSFDLVLGLW